MMVIVQCTIARDVAALLGFGIAVAVAAAAAFFAAPCARADLIVPARSVEVVEAFVVRQPSDASASDFAVSRTAVQTFPSIPDGIAPGIDRGSTRQARARHVNRQGFVT
jgi:hypothetical protein